MYCSKGPWLPWDDEEAVRAFFQGATSAASVSGAHTLKIEPEVHEDDAGTKALLDDLGFHDARYDLNFDTTVTVDLNPSEDELLANMRKSTRYGVRKAAREGVEVVEPEDFEEAWNTFFDWMEDTAERKSGFTIRRPKAYLHDMMRTMHDAARQNGIHYYDMVGIPKPENRNEDDPYYGVYRFKIGFGGDVTDFVGCLDLPLKPARAKAWYELEPIYYRLYYKLRGNVFY
jgi:lipid II:glycine glycyltransferase (peptidoglycan interpeptide bridge formation enzyme)